MKPFRLALAALNETEVKCAICGVSNSELFPAESTQYYICTNRSQCIARLHRLVSIYPEGAIMLFYDGIPMVRLFYLNFLYHTFLSTHTLEHYNDCTY